MIKRQIIIPIMGNSKEVNNILKHLIINNISVCMDSRKNIIVGEYSPTVFSNCIITSKEDDYPIEYRQIDSDSFIVKRALCSKCFEYDENRKMLKLLKPEINVSRYQLFNIIDQYKDDTPAIVDCFIKFIDIPTYALDYVYEYYWKNPYDRASIYILPLWIHEDKNHFGKSFAPYLSTNQIEESVFQSFEVEKQDMNFNTMSAFYQIGKFRYSLVNPYTEHFPDIFICNMNTAYDAVEDAVCDKIREMMI